MKKAMVERMKQSYKKEWFPEDGAPFPIRVSIMKDEVTVGLDTSGESLHKRGYRKLSSKAPITETLAAALILLTPWREDRILVDPFCGSGTIPIEAAMIGANIAPGMNREFLSEEWTHLVPKKLWYDAINEAEDLINIGAYKHGSNPDIDYAIQMNKAVNEYLCQDVEEKVEFEDSVERLKQMFEGA
jgi:putative N6-adenine-specific DNA methylase